MSEIKSFSLSDLTQSSNGEIRLEAKVGQGKSRMMEYASKMNLTVVDLRVSSEASEIDFSYPSLTPTQKMIDNVDEYYL